MKLFNVLLSVSALQGVVALSPFSTNNNNNNRATTTRPNNPGPPDYIAGSANKNNNNQPNNRGGTTTPFTNTNNNNRPNYNNNRNREFSPGRPGGYEARMDLNGAPLYNYENSNAEYEAGALGPRKQLSNAPANLVQGSSLKTWSFSSPALERVQVVLSTEGRPLDASVELWQGPDNTPQRMRVYVENGNLRPFNAFIETPRSPNTIAIRNIGQMEFPLAAQVSSANGFYGSYDASNRNPPITIQGGALKTYPFDPTVRSVQVLLKTDGRPLTARIELLQGPNNSKQVIEVYSEDGLDRPFFMIVETPGSGNVVRIQNTAPVEFPMYSWVQSYETGDNDLAGLEPVVNSFFDNFRRR